MKSWSLIFPRFGDSFRNFLTKIKKSMSGGVLAKSMNLSVSKYISNVSEQKTANSWDDETKKLSGAWDDFSSIDEIRSNENIEDSKRENWF